MAEVGERASLAPQEINSVFGAVNTQEMETDKQAEAPTTRAWPGGQGKEHPGIHGPARQASVGTGGGYRGSRSIGSPSGSRDGATHPEHGEIGAASRTGNGEFRSETGFLIFFDTPFAHDRSVLPKLKLVAEEWGKKFTEGAVTSPLRVIPILAVIKEFQERLKEGATALDPAWIYHVWDPKQKKQVRSQQQPATTTQIQNGLEVLLQNLGTEGVCLNFRNTKNMEDEYT
ncbi:Pol [Symbiodinium sp. CCMP2592]|nr:Pol [Symbiodinium sp. CCMP2592]